MEEMMKPSPWSFQRMYSLQASSCRMFQRVSNQTVIFFRGFGVSVAGKMWCSCSKALFLILDTLGDCV